MQGFLVVARGSYTLVACIGFSCGSGALGAWASIVVAPGL